MHNCIFSGHCIKSCCDQSCPALAESSHLLTQNGIGLNSNVFHTESNILARYNRIIENSDSRLQTVVANNTNQAAELLAYCGICKYWKGSRLHTVVYSLKLSQYLESIQNSWSRASNTDNLEYQDIWLKKAKLLIISNSHEINRNLAPSLLHLIQSPWLVAVYFLLDYRICLEGQSLSERINRNTGYI